MSKYPLLDVVNVSMTFMVIIIQFKYIKSSSDLDKPAVKNKQCPF